MEIIEENVLVKDDVFLTRRKDERRHITTKERVLAFCSETNAEWDKSSEIVWGKPCGKEVW
jgi:hypothetical protein